MAHQKLGSWERLILLQFATRLETTLKHCVPIAVRRMKPFVRTCLDNLFPDHSEDVHLFMNELEQLRRTPDGMCVLSAADAQQLGMGQDALILALEAEHSSPLTRTVIDDYAGTWDQLQGYGLEVDFGVAIIERYGRFQLLNLSTLYFASTRNMSGAPIPTHCPSSVGVCDLLEAEWGPSLLNPQLEPNNWKPRCFDAVGLEWASDGTAPDMSTDRDAAPL